MSPKNHTILSARRGYEYPIDGIRLSVICTSVVQEELTKTFGFQTAAVSPLPDIFGVVRPTTPPGLILQVGELKGSDVIPIRALMFDSMRMIIDVAAPSSAIDRVKRKVEAVLRRFKAPEDQPLLTTPVATWDQSDVVIEAKLPNSLGLSPRAFEALASSIPGDLTRMVSLRVLGVSGDTFADVPMTFTLEPRVDSGLKEHRWFSSAPLDSRHHLAYLDGVIRTLGSRA